VKARKRCRGEATLATGISGAYWRGSRPGPMTTRAASRPACQGTSVHSRAMPVAAAISHVWASTSKRLIPGREAGRERAEGQVAWPLHVGRGPRGPRRPGGRPQRQPVVAADEIAGRRARVIAAARGEVGELQRDADGVVHHVTDRPARAWRLQRQLAG